MTIIYGLLGLGVIIFVHELGHFIAARACGVRVETFSVGMGPVLIHKKIGDTDYRLSLIPLGGYCGMRGEKAFQEALDKKLDYIPHEEHSFYGVHPLRRIIIAFAGPFSNLLFAIVAMSVIAMVGYTYYTTPSRIILATQVYENMDSRAEEAGLQTGDIITSINGKPVEYFSDISQTVSLSPEEVLVIQVLRGSQQLEFTLLPELDTSTGAGRIGVVNWVDPVVQAVLPGSVADIAGLMPGDIITEVEGMQVFNTTEFSVCMQGLKQAHIAYTRNGVTETTVLNFSHNSAENNAPTEIGIQWQILEVKSPTYNFFFAFVEGTKETFNLLVLTVKSIGLLFKGVDVTKAVSGPIGITVMLGETTRAAFSGGFAVGLVTVLNFLALISISLCIMNLLPIPILDGGLILFATIEFFRGKAVKPAILYKVQFIGIGFIVFLFILGFVGDINRLFIGN